MHLIFIVRLFFVIDVSFCTTTPSNKSTALKCKTGFVEFIQK